MVVINKISPDVEILSATDEHEISYALMNCFGLSHRLSTLLYAVFVSCPKLLIRNSYDVPTSALYNTNMVASILSGSSGLEIVLNMKPGDDTYYIVDFIDVIDGNIRLAIHRLQDSVVKDAVLSFIRPHVIDDILKELSNVTDTKH